MNCFFFVIVQGIQTNILIIVGVLTLLTKLNLAQGNDSGAARKDKICYVKYINEVDDRCPPSL